MREEEEEAEEERKWTGKRKVARRIKKDQETERGGTNIYLSCKPSEGE